MPRTVIVLEMLVVPGACIVQPNPQAAPTSKPEQAGTEAVGTSAAAATTHLADAGVTWREPRDAAAHGGLSAKEIRDVVVAHRGALMACYELEASNDATLKGTVTVRWRIGPEGSVTEALPVLVRQALTLVVTAGSRPSPRALSR
jgi:hypothetical protein